MDRPFECSKCARYEKQIAILKEVLDEYHNEFSYQSRRHEDELSDLQELCLYWQNQYENVGADLEDLKAKRISSSQTKMMLGQVGGPQSNITLRASDPLDTMKGR